MGNRYTETTLTARELNTLQSMRMDLDKIMLKNLKKSNPDRKSIALLMKSRDNITRTIDRVKFMRGRNE
jgi:hypothetical protein